MIICPECESRNEDDILTCRNCGALLETGPAERGGGVRPGEDDDADHGTLEAALDLPAREERREEPSPPQEPASSEPKGEAGDGVGLDLHHQRSVRLFEQGRTSISVIGFASSGKTFLVNRWREELPKRGDWAPDEPPELEIPLSPEGLIHTQFEATDPKRRGTIYSVVDCAGESLDTALKSKREHGDLRGRSSVRSYLAALAFADAYLLVIEADDLVRGGGPESENVRRALAHFYDILKGIVIAKQRLRRQPSRDFLEEGIDVDEFDNVFKHGRRFTMPICVVFAQADKLETLGAEGFPDDPYLFAQTHTPELFQAVKKRFSHYRFEFVSAFCGFQPRDRKTPNPDYSLPSYGTASVFDWIDRQLRPRPPVVGRLARIAGGGAASTLAVGLRRLVDPAFRRRAEGRRG